jgi:hypothetical protein
LLNKLILRFASQSGSGTLNFKYSLINRDTMAEEVKVDYTCPHSNESFSVDQEYYWVYVDKSSTIEGPFKWTPINSPGSPDDVDVFWMPSPETFAYFHEYESALKWRNDHYQGELLKVYELDFGDTNFLSLSLKDILNWIETDMSDLGDSDELNYTITIRRMTQEEYDALPEWA